MPSDPKRPIVVREQVPTGYESRDIEHTWSDLFDTFDYSTIVTQLMIRVEEIAAERDAAIARAEKAEAKADRLAAECWAWRECSVVTRDGGCVYEIGAVLDPADGTGVFHARAAVDAAGDLKETP